TSVRSLIVLLYSDRLRRRRVTRPGSPIVAQSTEVSWAWSQPTIVAASAWSGRGFPLGGISPDSTASSTDSHVFRALRLAAVSVCLPMSSSPLGFAPPWQLRQYFASSGATFPWNAASAAAWGEAAGAGGSAARALTIGIAARVRSVARVIGDGQRIM